MKRTFLALLTPPVAVCRFGCASCCAAPIAVFWVTGIIAMLYGFVGGPTNLMGPSWNTILLGMGLWGIAVVWTTLAIRGADRDRCADTRSSLCRRVLEDEEPDPFDELRKAR